MKLPDRWEQFYTAVKDRTESFIDIGYLTIEKPDLANWLDNFKTDEGKFLSSLLLYRLTFRNQKAVLSMLRQIVDIIIPNVLKTEIGYQIPDLESFHNSLQAPPRKSKLPFRLSTITTNDEIAKSGHSLLRDFQRKIETTGKIGYHNDLNISPEKYGTIQNDYPEVKLIFIIDDFLGSGNAFNEFAERYGFRKHDLKFVYLPLGAHQEGISKITCNFPNIILRPIEKLDNRNSFFSNSLYPSFITQHLSEEDLKELYQEVFINNYKLGNKERYGFGELAICHCYDDSVPNNMLPIFWREGLGDWNNLFKR